MLTSRGWWFLVINLVLLVFGVLRGLGTVTTLGLALLLWFILEWLLFSIRIWRVDDRLSFRRELSDERGPVQTLWAGRVFRVRLDVLWEGALALPYTAVTDGVPFGVEHVGGARAACGALEPDESVSLVYQVRCPSVGRARFEGVRVRSADLQGFFYHVAFVRAPVEYRVLPVLVNETGRATAKRHNLLPPPGVDRLRRAGTGSELLDLRDYLPGDPPRTIAWKVSARRDRLITKDFESEVPLRCTLFVDTSNSVRLGPPGRNALARLAGIAAAVAQVNIGARDLTGICLFDEQESTTLPPARSARHLALLLNVLADSASLAPSTGEAAVDDLLPAAYLLAHELYPELLRAEVNHLPSWLPWLRPIPQYRGGRRSLAGGVGRWLFAGIAFLPFLALATVCYFILDYIDSQLPELLPSGTLDWYILVTALAAVFYIRLTGALYRALPLWVSPRRRRLARWRKQLAALLSVRYGLAPGGVGLLLESDRELSVCLQRFLAEHHVAYPLPLYDARGRYLFRAPTKVNVLATALLRAVGRGHDNELFVLLADLLELDEQTDPLLRAVRVALSRHHQVIVVCPWPVAEPPSGGQGIEDILFTEAGARPSADEALDALLKRITAARLGRAFQRVRRSFAHLGVAVVNAGADDPVPLILDRMDRLRVLGRRR